MIIVDAKLVTYSQATAMLNDLQIELMESEQELEDIESKQWELEGDISSLQGKIDDILEQIKSTELNRFLSTPLFKAGYRLMEVFQAQGIARAGFWEEIPSVYTRFILTGPEGEEEIGLSPNPSLSEILSLEVTE